MDYIETAFRNGIAKAAAKYGITDPSEVLSQAEAERIVSTSLEKQQIMSKAGATILAYAGMDNTPEYHVLCKCASSNILLPDEVQDAFIRPVEDVLEKRSMFLAPIASFITDKTGTALGLAALLGTAAGGTYYLGEKSISETDAETEAKIEQARIYRETAKRIQKEMQKKQREKNLAPAKSFVY